MSKLGYVMAFVLLAVVLATPVLADDVDRYIKDLKDGNTTVRLNAAYALGKIKDPRAVEPLITALKDNNSVVRVDAAWALGRIKDPKAVEPLIRALKDTNSTVRGNAAWALGQLGWQQGTSSIGEGRTFQVGRYNISVGLAGASLAVENISIEKPANLFTIYTAKTALYYDNKTVYIAIIRMDGILGLTSQALEDLFKGDVYIKEVRNRSIDKEPGYLVVGTAKQGEAFYGATYQRQISSGCEIVIIGSKVPLEDLLDTIHIEASSNKGNS